MVITFVITTCEQSVGKSKITEQRDIFASKEKMSPENAKLNNITKNHTQQTRHRVPQ